MLDESTYTEREKQIHLRGFEMGARSAFLKVAEQPYKHSNNDGNPMWRGEDTLCSTQNCVHMCRAMDGTCFKCGIQTKTSEDK